MGVTVMEHARTGGDDEPLATPGGAFIDRSMGSICSGLPKEKKRSGGLRLRLTGSLTEGEPLLFIRSMKTVLSFGVA